MYTRKLPIGIQTFREIRGDGCDYMDKTGFIRTLIARGKYYFLSRPRRFGKSLPLDTIAEVFADNEPPFRGLPIHPHWDWSVRFPVVRLSFAEGVLHSRAALDARIDDLLRINALTLDLTLHPGPDAVGTFGELICQAQARHGQRAVVLVDEYDKPILDNLTRPEVAREMRDGLRNLYSVIKGADAHVRFAFLTGVGKFSKVSIFSGLNNLYDIAVVADYSALCGYTEADADTVCAPELPGLDRAEIRRRHNGYDWSGEPVYNPFDLLLFQDRGFRSYWFETGTPSFLIELLTRRPFFTPRLAQLRADISPCNSTPRSGYSNSRSWSSPPRAGRSNSSKTAPMPTTTAHCANRSVSSASHSAASGGPWSGSRSRPWRPNETCRIP
jgi:hypothetical protein